MRSLFAVVMLSLSLSFVGCAATGGATTTSVSEGLAAGYSAVTAVRSTTTALLNANKISSSDGQNVLTQTDNARAGLDIAREMAKTDLTSASGKLTAVRTGLTALQVYLATKGGG